MLPFLGDFSDGIYCIFMVARQTFIFEQESGFFIPSILLWLTHRFGYALFDITSLGEALPTPTELRQVQWLPYSCSDWCQWTMCGYPQCCLFRWSLGVVVGRFFRSIFQGDPLIKNQGSCPSVLPWWETWLVPLFCEPVHVMSQRKPMAIIAKRQFNSSQDFSHTFVLLPSRPSLNPSTLVSVWPVRCQHDLLRPVLTQAASLQKSGSLLHTLMKTWLWPETTVADLQCLKRSSWKPTMKCSAVYRLRLRQWRWDTQPYAPKYRVRLRKRTNSLWLLDNVSKRHHTVSSELSTYLYVLLKLQGVN